VSPRDQLRPYEEGRVASVNNRRSQTGLHRVRKAVFPVAGFGTRFLPATKAVPKEMLPVVDRPLIQYAVDEAIAAGIDELIFVTHRSKRAIEDYFDRAPELESELERTCKHEPLAELRGLVPPNVRISYARQSAPLGLGHAIWSARHLIGDQPFAVVLPDDLIDADPPALAQLVGAFAECGRSQIAVQSVARDDVSRYGVVELARSGNDARIRRIVEKPRPADAPSTLAVVGRYVFSPRIVECLRDLPPGAGNEVQLTDAIERLLAREEVHAYRYTGYRYDCGSKLGFLEATVAYALKHPQLGSAFQRVVDSAATAAVAAFASSVVAQRPTRPAIRQTVSVNTATTGVPAAPQF
jgi:UTP--glucose-1-phosphate uridylyltransferase